MFHINRDKESLIVFDHEDMIQSARPIRCLVLIAVITFCGLANRVILLSNPEDEMRVEMDS